MTSKKKKILMFGYLPPPYFGPSTAYRALMNSEFPQRFDVTFINLSVVRDLRELERFRIGKVVKLFRIALQEIYQLLKHRFDYCCYPVSFNRNALLKDAMLLGIARAFGVPTVLWAHGNNLPDFQARSSRWVQRLIDHTVRKARAAIVLGERLRFNFHRQLPEEQIFSVPLGIEPPPAVPIKERPRPGFAILYLGNLIRNKGVFTLLEAAPLILAKRPDARFIFAGAWYQEQQREEAERFVRERELQSHVEFVGLVTGEAKWQTLAQSDLLAFPTFYYYETFGFVLLEAMSVGLPIVTTPRASIPEIVEEGVNGLLVKEQDPKDLAEKILQLADDPGLRERMAQANREKFKNFYTHERYGQRMIAVFERLAAR